MECLRKHPSVIIWSAIDDVLYLKNKSFEKHQTRLKGSVSGYGEWGCIFDAFKRLKPEAYYTKNCLENSLASNNFRTKRLNIKSYKVCSNDISLLIRTDDKYINAYANPFDSTLYIGKCSFFTSIAWGNCFGKINKSNTFAFTLSIGNK